VYALADIEIMLQSSGKGLKDYPPMPRADCALVLDVKDVLINDELNYDRKALTKEHKNLMSSMTSEQRNVYDTIMTRVSQNKPDAFFLYGYGGTGKTFLWRTMAAALRSQGEIVLIVASSGIAAILIPGGRTAHSRFRIPILIHKTSTCPIEPDSPLALLIIKEKLIIWNEAPMMHRHCFEAVDQSFRDVMRDVGKKFKHIPFGGKIVVFGGDFRHILHVVPKGTRQEIVNSIINSSYIWNYCEVLTLTKNMGLLSGASDADIEERRLFSDWVLAIGDGNVGLIDDVDISL